MLHLNFRRAPLALALVTVAVAAAGCSDARMDSEINNSEAALKKAPVQQIYKTCVSNIFNNGLLPEQPAEQECVQCIVTALGQMGFKQKSGETKDEYMADSKLTSTEVTELNNACNQSQASD